MLRLHRDVEPVREGKETREFWEAIGGYEEYATGKRLEVTGYSVPTKARGAVF